MSSHNKYERIGTLSSSSLGAARSGRPQADHFHPQNNYRVHFPRSGPVLPPPPRLEHHIAYLLQETGALRAQNAHLVATAATQQQLEAQVSTLAQQLEELSGRVSAGQRELAARTQENLGDR
jgi:GAF domain-containing protein